MRKLRLEIDSLSVASFPVAPELPDFRGTVRAADLHATHALYCTNGDT